MGNRFDAESRAPVLLLVESRRRRFTDSVLVRRDIDTVLLRVAAEATPATPPNRRAAGSGAAESRVPVFILHGDRPLAGEVARYRAWTTSIGLVPCYFCNHDEAAQPLVNAFAAAVGLPHLAPGQVRLATDKMAMKELFAAAGLPSARFRAVSSAAQVKDFAQRLGWPVVVKPIKSGSSVDVWRFHDDQMPEVDRLLSGRPGPGGWMVEEHIAGSEFQMCALVHEGVVLDTYVAANPAPILDAIDGAMNGDITLAPSEPKPIDALSVMQRITDVMGYAYGYLHAEFFVRPDGSFIMGEIAARLSGAELPADHGLAYGFDIFAAVADLYVGRRPQLRYTRDRSVGDLLLPAGKGYVSAISPLSELLALPGVLDGELRAAEGDYLDPPRTSGACSGYVHVEGPESAVVLERMVAVLDRFRLELRDT